MNDSCNLVVRLWHAYKLHFIEKCESAEHNKTITSSQKIKSFTLMKYHNRVILIASIRTKTDISEYFPIYVSQNLESSIEI